MSKNTKRKSKKEKDLVKEVKKEDEKWYGLEKKFWTVVEFGVYTLLLTFASVSIGVRYQALKDENNATIIIDDGGKSIEAPSKEGFSYIVDDICDQEECDVDLTTIFGEDEIVIHYSNNESETILNMGPVEIEPTSRLKEFAMLNNGYIATIEYVSDNESRIVYYDKEGNELKSYYTNLDSVGDLSLMYGVYGTCSSADKKVSIYQYTISEDGTFNENTLGTFGNTNCR